MRSADGFPYHFDSQACAACGGACCRGLGGYVWISLAELERMAAAKGMAAALFARRFVRQAADGRLSLRELVVNGEHLCCFFDQIACRCMIYDSRPEQCRSFPFWDKFKTDWQELRRDCPGLVADGSHAQIGCQEECAAATAADWRMCWWCGQGDKAP